MVPYSATDVLRVMQYELEQEPVHTLGNRADVHEDEFLDDDQDTPRGLGQLIRLIVVRHQAPSAA